MLFNLTNRRVLIFIATDSSDIKQKVRKWAVDHTRTSKVIMQSGNSVKPSKKYSEREAAKVGAQLSNAVQFKEAENFLLDLHFMMHAKYFGGLCMSQPARIVMNIGFLKGRLMHAVAFDEQNIHLNDRWKFGESEGWSKLSDILDTKSPVTNI